MACRVALPPTYTCHNVSHVSLLVKDRPWDPSMNSLEAVGWPPVRHQAGLPTGTYEVDCIMAQRGTGDSAQNLIKWRGAPEDRATWEPESNLTGCKAFLRAWRKHQRKQPRQGATHTARLPSHQGGKATVKSACNRSGALKSSMGSSVHFLQDLP